MTPGWRAPLPSEVRNLATVDGWFLEGWLIPEPPGPLLIHLFDLKQQRLSLVPGSQSLWTARRSADGRYIAALTEDASGLMLFEWRCQFGK